MHTFLKFLCVGIINTIVGFGIIFLLMYFGVIPEISNIIGYTVGINVSYILNKKITFKSNKSHVKEFPKFLLSVGLSYILNFLGLLLFYRFFKINPYISKILSGAIYTISGFLLFKYFVFKNK